ncbi:hypothetical protein EUGRSUZ_A00260 [Eucalyptus grandis]|uniref:Uncharacterized protein n=2 Tax=Eucalyptus grandis TaxID=71139 RepID=A0ACC3LY81_EUCGR|nr:hypothetical protein EUGRSUZ_A00260 [Eucalyptus grandis]
MALKANTEDLSQNQSSRSILIRLLINFIHKAPPENADCRSGHGAIDPIAGHTVDRPNLTGIQRIDLCHDRARPNLPDQALRIPGGPLGQILDGEHVNHGLRLGVPHGEDELLRLLGDRELLDQLVRGLEVIIGPRPGEGPQPGLQTPNEGKRLRHQDRIDSPSHFNGKLNETPRQRSEARGGGGGDRRGVGAGMEIDQGREREKLRTIGARRIASNRNRIESESRERDDINPSDRIESPGVRRQRTSEQGSGLASGEMTRSKK